MVSWSAESLFRLLHEEVVTALDGARIASTHGYSKPIDRRYYEGWVAGAETVIRMLQRHGVAEVRGLELVRRSKREPKL